MAEKSRGAKHDAALRGLQMLVGGGMRGGVGGVSGGLGPLCITRYEGGMRAVRSISCWRDGLGQF